MYNLSPLLSSNVFNTLEVDRKRCGHNEIKPEIRKVFQKDNQTDIIL